MSLYLRHLIPAFAKVASLVEPGICSYIFRAVEYTVQKGNLVLVLLVEWSGRYGSRYMFLPRSYTYPIGLSSIFVDLFPPRSLLLSLFDQ